VVAILDKKTSKSERVMALVRNFVLFTLKHNILFRAKYVEGVFNVIEQYLERGQAKYLSICKFVEIIKRLDC
jgi:hypothetical protein